MLATNARKIPLILVGPLLLVSPVVAVVIHHTVRYEQPVRAIRGRVAGPMGDVISVVWVDVYDNARLSQDDSMPPVEKRKRQTKIASVEPNANGEFNIKHLPKGFYEVEVGNHGGGGYNVLSVLVNVDPKGTNDKLCVNLSLEGGGGESRVAKCNAK